MRVFIYDDADKKVKDIDGKYERVHAAKLNKDLAGKFEKGIFKWKEGMFSKERNMDILFKHTIPLPVAKKKYGFWTSVSIENCAKAVFDGMNYVQVGWDNTGEITKEERELSRANLVRDYENMKLSDENKMTSPVDFLQNLLPYLIILACVVSIVSIFIITSNIRDVQKPILQNMSTMSQQNGAMLRFLIAKMNSTNVTRG